MLRVLGRSTSGNVQKVLWLLEELDIPYQREDYGRQFNNTQDAAYLNLNPNGKVPTLVDGDVVIWESNTILRYLCNKAGNTAFYPADPATRTRVERWMDWQLSALNNPYLGIFKEAKKPAEERGASWATDSKDLIAQLQILEKALASQPWLAGKDLSLAEFSLASIVTRCLAFPVELPALPKLQDWRDRLLARPAFKKVFN